MHPMPLDPWVSPFWVERTISHEVKSPTETAFKLGFGLTAGVFSFRGIVFLVVGTSLVLATIRLIQVLAG